MSLVKTYVILFAVSFLWCQVLSAADTKDDVDALLNRSSRIQGGNVVTNRSHIPYQVSLLFDNTPICSASIIDHRNLLTAAHCVTDRDGNSPAASRFVAVIGGLDIHGNEADILTTTRQIRRIIVHENFNPTNRMSDLAILRIDVLTFNENITNVPIAGAIPVLPAVCLLAGWGATSYGGAPSRLLRYTVVPLIGQQTCRQNLGSIFLPGMICAGSQATDACVGDEGAALVCNGFQVGIVSWGLGCGDTNLQSIYTSVPHFFTWIQVNQESDSNMLGSSRSLMVFSIIICSLIKIIL